MDFTDIPVRQNGKDHNIDASWWNTIRTKLINNFDNGGQFKPVATQSLANGGFISIQTDSPSQILRVQGDGAAITLSSNPLGTENLVDGRVYSILGVSDTNTVQIDFSDSAKGVILNGLSVVLKKWYKIDLVYLETEDRFLELGRNF